MAAFLFGILASQWLAHWQKRPFVIIDTCEARITFIWCHARISFFSSKTLTIKKTLTECSLWSFYFTFTFSCAVLRSTLPIIIAYLTVINILLEIFNWLATFIREFVVYLWFFLQVKFCAIISIFLINFRFWISFCLHQFVVVIDLKLWSYPCIFFWFKITNLIVWAAKSLNFGYRRCSFMLVADEITNCGFTWNSWALNSSWIYCITIYQIKTSLFQMKLYS